MVMENFQVVNTYQHLKLVVQDSSQDSNQSAQLGQSYKGSSQSNTRSGQWYSQSSYQSTNQPNQSNLTLNSAIIVIFPELKTTCILHEVRHALSVAEITILP